MDTTETGDNFKQINIYPKHGACSSWCQYTVVRIYFELKDHEVQGSNPGRVIGIIIPLGKVLTHFLVHPGVFGYNARLCQKVKSLSALQADRLYTSQEIEMVSD